MSDPRLHPRHRIRHRVVDLLVAAATAAGSRVVASRRSPWRKPQLPAIAVYCLEEEVDISIIDPRELERRVDLVIEAAAIADSDLDDALDALCLQVEAAMILDRKLAGTAVDSYLKSTRLELSDDGEREIGAALLTYQVTYRTVGYGLGDESITGLESSAGTLDDFLTAATARSLEGTQAEDDQSTDELALPQEEP